MLRTFRESWALFLGLAMLVAASGLLVTLLTIRGAQLGFSETAIGLMQAGYPLGALFGSVLSPKLVERVGHVRTFGALASLSSIAAVVHLITSDAGIWFLMRFLAGFCFPGLYVVCEAWLNAKAINRSRATVLSVYFVIQTLGSAAGQRLAGFDDPTGTVLFALTSILISLSLVPLLLSRSPAPDYEAPDRLSIRRFIRISPMAVGGAVLNGVAQAALYVGLPLYALALGMSAAQAAGLLVIATIAGGLAQFPVGWVSDRTDRRLVIAALSGIAAATCATMVPGLQGWALRAAVAVVAGATLPIYSLCVAQANDHLSPAQIVPASGTLVLVLNIGILFGAVAGPVLIGIAGPPGLMWLLSGFSAATFAAAMFRRAQAAPPEEPGTALPITVLGSQTGGAGYPETGPDRTA